MSIISENSSPNQSSSIKIPLSSNDRDVSTKSKSASKNLSPQRRSYKRSRKTMSYLSHSSRDLTLDPITEFPYLEDKFSSSAPCSLFSSSDGAENKRSNCNNSNSNNRKRTGKISHEDLLNDALHIVGRDYKPDSELSLKSRTRFHSPSPQPSLASTSTSVSVVSDHYDEDSDEDSVREDEERSILRESRWDDRKSRDVVSVSSGDRAPTCPVRNRAPTCPVRRTR